MTPTPVNQNPTTPDEQVAFLLAMARTNCVDAWDLGYQGQKSPGKTEEACRDYLRRFGFEQAKRIIATLDKRRK
jgi:hypothetical protein